MSETTGLMDKYGSTDGSSDSAFRQNIMDFKPDWDKYEPTRNHSHALKLLEIEAPAVQKKAILQDQLSSIMQALKTAQDDGLAKWILTLLYDMLREDSSCYSLFESALQNQAPIMAQLMAVLERGRGDTSYVPDKAAWLLSAVMGHLPRFFNDQDVKSMLITVLRPGQTTCSELGVLDAITNLLKSYNFRSLVWKLPGVPETIFKTEAKGASPPLLYKSVCAIWMISFDKDIIVELKQHMVVKKIKDILTTTRVEKVVRICLTLLKNVLSCKQLSEEVAEEGLLEAVQQLEYEKWRDAELYDDIREMQALIASEVAELSNFDRYERELKTGTLSWGFIHSTKFWAENAAKFEQHDFKAIQRLADLLADPKSSPETLAVACHDVGEFVAAHPSGKRVIARFGVKARVMELMGSQNALHREARREALLCCQRIMLNKWQDLEA